MQFFLAKSTEFITKELSYPSFIREINFLSILQKIMIPENYR